MSRHRYSEEEQAYYRRYINSPAWKAKKTARIAKAGNRCEFTTVDYGRPSGSNETRCTRTRYLCVHHMTYDRLGNEQDSDLEVVCWSHHMLEHLLMARCQCGAPRLANDEEGDKWLAIVLTTMGIDLDVGPVVWAHLPTKEILLEQVPRRCPACQHVFTKD